MINKSSTSPSSPRASNLATIIEIAKETGHQNRKLEHDFKKFSMKKSNTGENLFRQVSGSLSRLKNRDRSKSLPGTDKIVLPESNKKIERKTDIFRRQVRGLLKARNAFRRCLDTSNDAKEQEPLPEIVEIKSLPAGPRFASTLSVEAQYAIMKGYEDKVYGWISDRYPEKKRSLHRNSTPIMGVKAKPEPEPRVRDLSDKINTILLVNKAVQKVKKTETTSTTPWGETITNKENTTSKEEGRGIKTDDNGSTQMGIHNSPRKALRSSDRMSSEPLLMTQNRVPPFGRSRYGSLPCVPSEARLVMTNRYQIVMDIFDQLRQKEGVNPLSPRRCVKVNGQAPVREYNTWSQVWQKDFINKYNIPIAKEFP